MKENTPERWRKIDKKNSHFQIILIIFKFVNKSKQLQYIDDDIYEFRVNYGNNEFRIFFIYDGDKLVILFNAFRKKTQKTPRSEIEKAKRLKKEYYEDKNADI